MGGAKLLSPYFLHKLQMISKDKVQQLLEQKIANSDLFVVEIKIDISNNITVYLDANGGVTIDTCIEVSRFIEDNLDREIEDYALEVSSAGIGQPFKVYKQYEKALSKNIEVLFKSGIKRECKLTKVDEQAFEITYSVKEKKEGEKRPKMVEKKEIVTFDDVKSVKEIII